MTEIESAQALNASPTTQMRLDASAWVERADDAALTAEEVAALEAWLAESMAHRVAYWRADAAWKTASRLKVLRPVQLGKRAAFHTDVAIPFRGAIALVFIATVLAAVTLWPKKPIEQTFSTQIGGQKTISLNDGTKIELNTNTVLRVALAMRQRIVKLDHGEAYFEVTHDKDRPFLVFVAGHKITDLGTKFLVQADAGKLKVSLVEGRARIDTEDAWIQRHSAMLSPGDVIVATADSITRQKRDERHLAADLSWQKGQLTFFHTPLGEAVHQFNRYNETKVILADAALTALPINGTLYARDPQQFSRVLHNIFGLRVERKGGEIVISKNANDD